MNSWDYIIVGSGLTGATIARFLHDAGVKVLVVERRNHVGGNVYDHLHSSGIRVHTYGPHLFRTNSDAVWSWIQRFGEFYRYEHEVLTEVDGRLECWPIQAEYLTRQVGEHWQPDYMGDVNNFEEASLSMMPRIVFEKFVKPYSEKQWGVPAHSLAATLAGRFDVRTDGDKRLKQCKYQGLPLYGYAALMKQVLKGIPVLLYCDYLENRTDFTAQHGIIYTGPIDALFNYRFGKLRYRTQERSEMFHPHTDYALEGAVINYPGKELGKKIRAVEWKRLMPHRRAEAISGTLITEEEPRDARDPDEFEYPFQDHENLQRAVRYRELADHTKDVICCGRLGNYSYYDMTDAISQAMFQAQLLFIERGLHTAAQALDKTVSELKTLCPFVRKAAENEGRVA